MNSGTYEMRLCRRCVRTLASALPPGMRLPKVPLRYEGVDKYEYPEGRPAEDIPGTPEYRAAHPDPEQEPWNNMSRSRQEWQAEQTRKYRDTPILRAMRSAPELPLPIPTDAETEALMYLLSLVLGPSSQMRSLGGGVYLASMSEIDRVPPISSGEWAPDPLKTHIVEEKPEGEDPTSK
jgi:hypothetical protein